MNLQPFFKIVLDQDTAEIVICDLEHTIIYMNPAAISVYARDGGAELLGKCLLNCHSPRSAEMIKRVAAWFSESTEHNVVHTFYSQKANKDVYMVALRDEDGKLIGYYEKHEYRDRDTRPVGERF